jgi:hypothetical protein
MISYESGQQILRVAAGKEGVRVSVQDLTTSMLFELPPLSEEMVRALVEALRGVSPQ